MPNEEISENIFLEKNKVIRMGIPPVRLAVIPSASGIDFGECYANREIYLYLADIWFSGQIVPPSNLN